MIKFQLNTFHTITNDIQLFNRIMQKFQIIPNTGYFSVHPYYTYKKLVD